MGPFGRVVGTKSGPFGGPTSTSRGTATHIGQGRFLTASHVVADEKGVVFGEKFTVELELGSEKLSVKVEVADKDPALDVALLRAIDPGQRTRLQGWPRYGLLSRREATQERAWRCHAFPIGADRPLTLKGTVSDVHESSTPIIELMCENRFEGRVNGVHPLANASGGGIFFAETEKVVGILLKGNDHFTNTLFARPVDAVPFLEDELDREAAGVPVEWSSIHLLCDRVDQWRLMRGYFKSKGIEIVFLYGTEGEAHDRFCERVENASVHFGAEYLELTQLREKYWPHDDAEGLVQELGVQLRKRQPSKRSLSEDEIIARARRQQLICRAPVQEWVESEMKLRPFYETVVPEAFGAWRNARIMIIQPIICPNAAPSPVPGREWKAQPNPLRLLDELTLIGPQHVGALLKRCPRIDAKQKSDLLEAVAASKTSDEVFDSLADALREVDPADQQIVPEEESKP